MDKTQSGARPFKLAFAIMGRLILALGLVGGAAIAGYFLGMILANVPYSKRDIVTLAGLAGIGAILVKLDEFLKHAYLLLCWILTRNGNGAWWGFSSFIFVTVLTITVAAGAPLPEHTEAPVATSNSVLFANVAAHGRVPKGDESRFLIPFFADAKGCDTTQSQFKEGAELDEGTKGLITQLAKGLLHCARQDKPVRLEVRGFASSEQFTNCGSNQKHLDFTERRRLDEIESQRLNKEIANARARVVVNWFARAQDAARNSDPSLDGRVHIAPIIWDDFNAMKADQRWNDTSAGTYSAERALLTRRVELRIVDSGDCEVTTSLRPKPIVSTATDEPSLSQPEG